MPSTRPELGEVWLADLGLAAKNSPRGDRLSFGRGASARLGRLRTVDDSEQGESLRGGSPATVLFAGSVGSQCARHRLVGEGSAGSPAWPRSGRFAPAHQEALRYALDL